MNKFYALGQICLTLTVFYALYLWVLFMKAVEKSLIS